MKGGSPQPSGRVTPLGVPNKPDPLIDALGVKPRFQAIERGLELSTD